MANADDNELTGGWPAEGWKKERSSLGCAALFWLIPVIFVGVLLVIEGSFVIRGITGLRRMETKRRDTYFGTLDGTSRTTPSGAGSILWFAWLDVDSPGDDDGAERACTISSLTGLEDLSLKLDDASLKLPLSNERVDLSSRERLSVEASTTGVILRSAEKPPPADLSLCGSIPNGTQTYYEANVERALPVVVMACRSGGRLSPCADGLNFLVTHCGTGDSEERCRDVDHGIRTIRYVLASDVMDSLRGLGIAFGIMLLIAGGIAAYHHRQAGRRFGAARWK